MATCIWTCWDLEIRTGATVREDKSNHLAHRILQLICTRILVIPGVRVQCSAFFLVFLFLVIFSQVPTARR